ncbi:hypothetical protein J21TS7_19160 [Paenibacillus cineris]|uniref:Secreted protein n=1 Tax=Paenibacillus cineris TaxID=237530 RepID=A0ABQ4LAZ0_9BACL|nr:hypothetical protein J21TS7_19160 [Paenibacillus cineris]
MAHYPALVLVLGLVLVLVQVRALVLVLALVLVSGLVPVLDRCPSGCSAWRPAVPVCSPGLKAPPQYLPRSQIAASVLTAGA